MTFLSVEVSLGLPVKFVLRRKRHEVASDDVLEGKYRESPGAGSEAPPQGISK